MTTHRRHHIQLFIFSILLLFSIVSTSDARVWNFAAVEYSEDIADETHHVAGMKGIPPGYTSFKVTSVSNMVCKIQSYMEPGDTIGNIQIRGHGSYGIQSVGGGKEHWDQPDKSINLYNTSEWKTTLAPLKGKFSSEGSITLLGCQVAAKTDGAQLVHELQSYLETNAEGAVDYVFVLFQEQYEEYGDIQVSIYPSPEPPVPMEPSWKITTIAAFLLSQSIPTLSEWKRIFLVLLMLSLIVGFTRSSSSTPTFSNAHQMLGRTNMPVFDQEVFLFVMKWTGLIVFIGFAGATAILRHVYMMDIFGSIFCAPLIAYITHVMILCHQERTVA